MKSASEPAALFPRHQSDKLALMVDVTSPRSDPAGPTHTTSKMRDFFELAIGYALILLVIWTPRPWQRIFYLSAAAYIVFVLWASFRSAQAMGLRTTNFFRSLWIVGVAMLMSAVAIILAIKLHTLHHLEPPIPFLKRYWGYALWSFAQQILLQDFFLRRLIRLIPRSGLAVLATASIFAIAHIPSPVLTVVTFSLGLAACLLFLRYRNLYPLAISHAILGVTIAITFPNPIIRNMRVGLGYLTYKQHHGYHGAQHHRSHSDQVVSTRAWVIAEAPTRRF